MTLAMHCTVVCRPLSGCSRWVGTGQPACVLMLVSCECLPSRNLNLESTFLAFSQNKEESFLSSWGWLVCRLQSLEPRESLGCCHLSAAWSARSLECPLLTPSGPAPGPWAQSFITSSELLTTQLLQFSAGDKASSVFC